MVPLALYAYCMYSYTKCVNCIIGIWMHEILMESQCTDWKIIVNFCFWIYIFHNTWRSNLIKVVFNSSFQRYLKLKSIDLIDQFLIASYSFYILMDCPITILIYKIQLITTTNINSKENLIILHIPFSYWICKSCHSLTFVNR